MSTNSEQDIVLLTGVSGFLASHVAVDLLRRGFRVRGTARQAKLKVLRASKLGELYPNLELTQVDDIASSDLTEVLRGVSSVIHVASPIGSTSAEVMLESAIAGTMNVLRQAKDAGVKNFVVTSSIVTVYRNVDASDSYSGITYSEKVFTEVTKEDALSRPDEGFRVYKASKRLAEIEALRFGQENPGIKIATINPPFIYGPSAIGFPPSNGEASLGTNGFVYTLLKGKLPLSDLPHFCDVRDVAKAHVAALLAIQANKIKPNEPQRFLVTGGAFHWKDAAEYLSRDAGVPEEIKKRLPSKDELDNAAPFPGPVSAVDTTLAKEILGIEEFIDWKTSVKDTVLCLSEEEKGWKL